MANTRKPRRTNKAATPQQPEITAEQAQILSLQGQWLIRQVQALCNRLAGEKMAAGLVDAQGASIMVQQELAKIEGGLREIDAAVKQGGAQEPAPAPRPAPVETDPNV